MSYSYKQWTQDQTADNVIHASDLERWQDGITDAGGTWSGSWTDEKDTLTADQLNALEAEIASLYGTGFTAKTWEDGQVPGVDEWNRIEDAINTILNRTAFAIYCETDNSLTFYVDTEVPSEGDTYDGKVVTNVYTGFDKVTWTSTSDPYWIDLVDVIESVTIDKSFSVCRPVSLAYWFYNFANITTVSGTGNIDTSSVTSLRSTFNGCSALTSVDVSNWDTSNVTTMYYMFNTCSSLTALDVSNWDTSNVTTMYYMFNTCSSLTALDVSNWNTSNVTTMYYMFNTCSSLTALDVSNWNTSKVTTMYGMFNTCSSLTTLDVSNWDTSNVTTMYNMFRWCYELAEIDVSKWDVSKVTTMYSMFARCYAVTELDVSKWDVSSLTNTEYLFANLTAVTELDVSSWDTSKVTTMRWMFYNCPVLKTIYSDDSKFVTTAVTQSTEMFASSPSLVGGNGTAYDSNKVDASMAHVDTEDNPGYFTAKG